MLPKHLFLFQSLDMASDLRFWWVELGSQEAIVLAKLRIKCYGVLMPGNMRVIFHQPGDSEYQREVQGLDQAKSEELMVLPNLHLQNCSFLTNSTRGK